MGKAFIVGLFAISVCFIISQLGINLSHPVFSAAGVPISSGVLLFGVVAAAVSSRIK